MKRETIFSADRVYRYTLWRKPQVVFSFEPRKWTGFVQFIGLNPSTADELKNDNTIRRLINFSSAWGFTEMLMTNLFAYRETKAAVMKRHPAPVGQDNDQWLATAAGQAGLVVCCWGRGGEHMGRGAVVESMLRGRGVKLHCFRLLEGNVPEHPLYLPKTLAPLEWTA